MVKKMKILGKAHYYCYWCKIKRITNDTTEQQHNWLSAMTLEKQPKNLLWFGAIGIEFAYFYNAMGAEVVIVEYLDQVQVEDEEVSKQLERSFKIGIKIYTNAEVKEVETKNKSNVIIKTKSNEKYNTDIVLSAVGIKTNIESIGLEDVGIAVDNDKIMVNNFIKQTYQFIMQ